MYFRIIFLHFLLKTTSAEKDNKMIIDYFIYKQVSSVVGYSCNLHKDDVSIIKQFSRNGIRAMMVNLKNDFDFRKFASANYWKLGIFLDVRCFEATHVSSLFFEATLDGMFNELHDWFVIAHNLSTVLNIIDDNALGVSTNLIIAIPISRDSYNFYDAYNTCRGCMINSTLYGSWDDKQKLNVRFMQSKYVRRSNLHGLKMKTIFFKSSYKPENTTLDKYLHYSPNRIKDGRSKFGYMILSHLGDIYNFSIEGLETEVWKAGGPVGPLARSLINFQVDLAGTPVAMVASRIHLLRYVHMGLPLRTCFIFRNPQPNNIKVQEIFRPFQNNIWFLTCLILGISVLILTLTLYDDQIESEITRVSNSTIIVIGALCQQCTNINVTQFSARIAFLSIMGFSILLYNFYSACVVSARLDEPISKINDSLVELGKLNLKMASERMVYLEYFFKAPLWETQVFYKNYWSKITESERFMEPESGLQLVQKGGFAYHVHPDVGYIVIERSFENHEICELMEVHLGRPSTTMFGVTNNSTFEELARVGLTKISEVGLRYRLLQKWQYRRPRCRKDILNATSINIYEFTPHLVLLLAGALISFFVLIVEIMLAKVERSI